MPAPEMIPKLEGLSTTTQPTPTQATPDSDRIDLRGGSDTTPTGDPTTQIPPVSNANVTENCT